MVDINLAASTITLSVNDPNRPSQGKCGFGL